MMAYCTITDIQVHLDNVDLGELTDDTGGGTVDTAKVTAAIAAADALINGYLRGSFSACMPLATTPELIKQISVTVSIYNIYNRKKSLIISDQLRKDYEDCLSMLKQIGNGTLDPGITTTTGEAATGIPGMCSKTDGDAYYNDDLWAGFL